MHLTQSYVLRHNDAKEHDPCYLYYFLIFEKIDNFPKTFFNVFLSLRMSFVKSSKKKNLAEEITRFFL